jgi:hypothetical protein
VVGNCVFVPVTVFPLIIVSSYLLAILIHDYSIYKILRF